MDGEPGREGLEAERTAEETTDSILEALLVEDAELRWDPKSGKPRVTRRPKTELDSPPGTT